MTTIKISQKLTLAELISNSWLSDQYKHFGMEHLLARHEARMMGRDDDAMYFIEKCDPENNFGLDFRIYERYMADGINFFGKVSHSSSLNNNSFKACTSAMFMVDEDHRNDMVTAGLITAEQSMTISIKDDCFSRSEESREYFRTNSSLFTITTNF
jgi:hypothetical protein